MAEKSPSAFRTISEVAETLDVPAHVLRFWESRFTQVKPVKRGGGRRYYRPTDVDLLRGIQKLLHSDGMTIKGAQKVLREKGVRYVMAAGQEAGLATAMQPVPDAPESAEDTPRDIADAARDIFAESDALESQAPIFPEEDTAKPEPSALETAEIPEMADGLFAQSFAEEAAATGIMDSHAPEAVISPDADMAGLTEEDTLEPEVEEIDAIDAPAPVMDISDTAPAAATAPPATQTDELRDIIGKLERLRDRMRTS